MGIPDILMQLIGMGGNIGASMLQDDQQQKNFQPYQGSIDNSAFNQPQMQSFNPLSIPTQNQPMPPQNQTGGLERFNPLGKSIDLGDITLGLGNKGAPYMDISRVPPEQLTQDAALMVMGGMGTNLAEPAIRKGIGRAMRYMSPDDISGGGAGSGNFAAEGKIGTGHKNVADVARTSLQAGKQIGDEGIQSLKPTAMNAYNKLLELSDDAFIGATGQTKQQAQSLLETDPNAFIKLFAQ